MSGSISTPRWNTAATTKPSPICTKGKGTASGSRRTSMPLSRTATSMAMTTVKVSKGVPPESGIEWRILAARYPRAKRGATSAANKKAPDFSAKSGARAFLADRGGFEPPIRF